MMTYGDVTVDDNCTLGVTAINMSLLDTHQPTSDVQVSLIITTAVQVCLATSQLYRCV